MKDANVSPVVKELSRKQARQSFSRWAAWFILSAGGILAFSGANHLFDAFEKSQVLNLQDPLSGIPFRYILLLLGLMELFLTWLCLFTNKRNLSCGIIAWLIVNFIVYRIGLWTMGWSHPWIFVGGLTSALNISPLLADGIIFQVILYLLVGSIAALLLTKDKPVISLDPIYFKIHCPACNGKTAFDAQWIGQTIPCPHCGSPLSLKSI